MPKAKFVLKDREKNEATNTACLVYLYFHFDYQRLKYSTGIKIQSAMWDEDDQRAITGKKYPLHNDLNQSLNQIEAAAGKAYYKLKNDGQAITPVTLREKLEQELGVGEAKGESKLPTLIEFAERHLAASAATKAKGTLQVYHSTLLHLKAFDAKRRRRTDLANVTLDWYKDFTEWLTTTQNLANNTVGKVLKTVKSFLREAEEGPEKLTVCQDYKSKRFAVVKEDSDSIYLNPAELETLANLELAENSTLAHIRDLFILGCYTALRFSDLSQLSAKQLSFTSGGKMLKIRAQKTGDVVTIPLHPIAEAVLVRNGGHPPRAYANATTNEYLKTIGKMAGFTQLVEVTTAKGKLKAKVFREKWELITTHTARRSAATNMYLAGIPETSIMMLTGHKKHETFRQYIKVKGEENAAKLLAHPYFSNSNMRVA